MVCKQVRKVSIGLKLRDTAWGGGNQAMRALAEYLAAQDVDVVFDLDASDIDVILLVEPNSQSESTSFTHVEILRYLLFTNPVPSWFTESTTRAKRGMSRALVVNLKHPSHCFARHLLVQSVRATAALLESLTTKGWQAALARALGVILTVPRLPTIWSHRSKCRLGGMVWIRPRARGSSPHASAEGDPS